MIGDRFSGWRGAFSALAGMMAVPLVIVLALTALYAQYAAHPMVAGALKGMGAVSAGMIVGTALKLLPTLKQNPMGVPVCACIGSAMFVCAALLRWPLVWVLAALGVLACCYAGWRLKTLRQAG
jgi:chromate transporter